jgi:hypothetical protein
MVPNARCRHAGKNLSFIPVAHYYIGVRVSSRTDSSASSSVVW